MTPAALLDWWDYELDNEKARAEYDRDPLGYWRLRRYWEQRVEREGERRVG